MVSSEDRDRFGSITMQPSTPANGFSKMKALWLDNSRLALRDDLPVPKSGPEEALVAVRLAGICGTDLALANGYYPFRGIPGHEFVGKIVQAAAAPERVGQRVVGEINIGCWQLARQAVRAQGVIVPKSTYRGSVRVDASALVVDEITVIGSRCGPFAPAITRLAEGQIDPRPLIEARYPLGEGPAAFAHAARPGALKVLLRVTS